MLFWGQSKHKLDTLKTVAYAELLFSQLQIFGIKARTKSLNCDKYSSLTSTVPLCIYIAILNSNGYAQINEYIVHVH